eukprot:1188250-Prorocentrum_minimum.AAC.2
MHRGIANGRGTNLGVGNLAVHGVELLNDLGQQVNALLVDQEVEEVAGGSRELTLLGNLSEHSGLLLLGHGGVGQEVGKIISADGLEGIHVSVNRLKGASLLGHVEESGRVGAGHLSVGGRLRGYNFTLITLQPLTPRVARFQTGGFVST